MDIHRLLVVGIAGLVFLVRIHAQDRLPAIPAEQLSEAQKNAVAEFLADRKVPVFGPFVPLLRSPELMLAVMRLGDYLRYRTSLPVRINELAILIASREWTQQLEWQIHYPLALKAGLDPAVVRAVAEGRQPDNLSEDEAIAWAFSTELQRHGSVSDLTYDRALKNFGEPGVVELAAVNGYYSFLAIVLNAARTGLPAGTQPALVPFSR
jgi:4-carboxymuconolactone decarboxylase